MLPHLRLRLVLLWSIFALAAVATGLAVHRLYQTAQQEITAQSERALAQERTKTLNRVQSYTEEVRRSIITELASFHVDGLAHALRQWDEANEIIVGTFQWDAVRGFSAGFEPPSGSASREQLIGLWQEFRAWRGQHATATNRDLTTLDGWQVLAYRTLDHPAFPAAALGYQSENLDILTHDGHRADPWAGWTASDVLPDAPWIFWYQAGPDAAVRGCLVDVRPIVRQLRSEITDTAYARLDFIGPTPTNLSALPLPGLPAHRLTADPGDIFHAKESRARFTALITASLFGLFLTGAAALTLYTRRAARDAERKITFVTQVSHELRTPLTSIRMFADMLAEPGLAEPKRLKFAGTISTECHRLSGLIERLLAFNALEKNSRKITCAAVDVSAVVRESLDEMHATLLKAGLSVATDLPAEPATALSDHSILKQALLNLLDNAVKYGGGGLRVIVTATPANILLRVADDGPGIPPAIRERVFEPFVQGGQTVTNKSPGVGLGLSLARGMLRQTGADLVLLDTTPGTTFEIRLPKTA